MSLDSQLISYVIRYDDINTVQRAGITEEDFVDEFRTVWKYILKVRRDHETLPSRATLTARFPDLDMPRVRASEVGMLIAQLRTRRRFTQTLRLLHATADQLTDIDRVDEAVQWLQGQLSSLAFDVDGESHLVDLFSKKAAQDFRREHRLRGSERGAGIKTGLKKLDEVTGGLFPQQMVTVIARTGHYKSWLNLLFVKSAVLQGKKVILYPLEMSVYETAARLYTLFSSDLSGQKRVIKNFDLMGGQVERAKLVRFMNTLEDRYKGQLLVADVGKLHDPYTVERIEAEVEAHKPDMFWVDYLTLLKIPRDNRNDNETSGIRRLSRGIKDVAARHSVVGGASAQVNRDGIRAGVGIVPRPEHIYAGDAIAHDSNLVVSVARKDGKAWYGLVKNRTGPEVEATRLLADLNRGVLTEGSED